MDSVGSMTCDQMHCQRCKARRDTVMKVEKNETCVWAFLRLTSCGGLGNSVGRFDAKSVTSLVP